MGLFINTNVAAINAQRHLLKVGGRLERSFERLASGRRVNSAADDAVGLAISERFNSQIRGMNQAVRNSNDAVSLVQVAESSLQEATNIMQRIRELALQSASDVNSVADREAIQDEVDQLKDELHRIGETTNFNSQKVLDGSYVDKFFHVGANFRETVRVRIRDARPKNLARHAVSTGDATTSHPLAVDSLAINGVTIRATRPVDDGLSTSFQSGSAISKASAINDGTEFHQVSAYVNPTVREPTAAPGGGILDEDDYITINDRIITGLNVGVDDTLETLVQAINSEFDFTGVIASRDANSQIVLTAQDGRNIEVEALGQGGVVTGLSSGVAQGTITLHSENQYRLTGANEDYIGYVDNALVGISSIQAVDTIDVTTREGANLALLIADRAIAQLTGDRAELGAIQNRLQSTISNLTEVSETSQAARSRILDADFAKESAELARYQILQQAGTSILAQANQSSQNALSLLQ